MWLLNTPTPETVIDVGFSESVQALPLPALAYPPTTPDNKASVGRSWYCVEGGYRRMCSPYSCLLGWFGIITASCLLELDSMPSPVTIGTHRHVRPLLLPLDCTCTLGVTLGVNTDLDGSGWGQ